MLKPGRRVGASVAASACEKSTCAPRLFAVSGSDPLGSLAAISISRGTFLLLTHSLKSTPAHHGASFGAVISSRRGDHLPFPAAPGFLFFKVVSDFEKVYDRRG